MSSMTSWEFSRAMSLQTVFHTYLGVIVDRDGTKFMKKMLNLKTLQTFEILSPPSLQQ
ncbi:hypothetical protein L915_21692, partial [Phytophthora nicotianae]